MIIREPVRKRGRPAISAKPPLDRLLTVLNEKQLKTDAAAVFGVSTTTLGRWIVDYDIIETTTFSTR